MYPNTYAAGDRVRARTGERERSSTFKRFACSLFALRTAQSVLFHEDLSRDVKWDRLAGIILGKS